MTAHNGGTDAPVSHPPFSCAFTVVGTPKGQPRPRAFARAGHIRMYDPGTAEGWKSAIADAAQDHIPPEPITAAVALSIALVFPRPKSHYRTGKHANKRKDSAPFWVATKPDIDNCAKAVMDALTELRFWRDDALVVKLTITQRYQGNIHRPGALIMIQELLP